MLGTHLNIAQDIPHLRLHLPPPPTTSNPLIAPSFYV